MAYTSITTKRFRQEKGTLAEKLATEFGLIDTELEALEAEYDTSVASLLTPLDLSGAAATAIVFVADRAYTLTEADLIYTEASSADTGVNVKVGKLIVGTDDDDFFVAAVASEVSKEAGYRKSLTLAQTAIAEGDVITINSAGSKTGTGEVILQLYLTRA